MFGGAYFGKAYFGGAYWGPSGGGLPPPVIVAEQNFGWINHGRRDEWAERWKARQAEIDRILDGQPSFLEHLADLERRAKAAEKRAEAEAKAQMARVLAGLKPMADEPLAQAVVTAAIDEEETEEMLIFLLV